MEVAFAYDFGEPRRGRAAVKWYAIAARLGEVDAMVNLAVSLERGLNVRKDPRAARYWYRRAARRGDSVALDHLKRLRRGEPIRK